MAYLLEYRLVAMPQTYYARPYPVKCLSTIIITILSIIYLLLCTTQGPAHPTSHITIITTFGITFLAILVDPETVYQTSRVLEDGTEVPVRRPLIRFKSCETLVGLTGGYEVRVDGWRYEEAFIRI